MCRAADTHTAGFDPPYRWWRGPAAAARSSRGLRPPWRSGKAASGLGCLCSPETLRGPGGSAGRLNFNFCSMEHVLIVNKGSSDSVNNEKRPLLV